MLIISVEYVCLLSMYPSGSFMDNSFAKSSMVHLKERLKDFTSASTNTLILHFDLSDRRTPEVENSDHQ